MQWNMNSRLRLLIALSLTILLTATACAEPDPVLQEETTATMDDAMDMDEEAAHEEYAFGEPSDEEPDRVIEVTAVDAFAFEPSELAVEVGETVTFRVTNAGKIPHDFTLGDADVQDEHEAEMAEMGDEMAMHDEPNVFSLDPGETKEMTWTFTEAGGILMGCHQTGHYAAGMVGTITITS
jgi:uncharacterized cupredoxin-like copper-binding protein